MTEISDPRYLPPDKARWNARYLARSGAATPPCSFVAGLPLPAGGRALDLAGGSGRHAIYLADQGLDVTCVDVSEAALELCEVEASKAGVVVRTVVLDLKTSAPPPGPWDLILVTNYWQPSLFAHFATLLAPGGCLAYSQPTWTNLERNPRPGRRFLAAPGQLETLAEDAGLAVLRCEEGWQSGRHESHLVAQRSAG